MSKEKGDLVAGGRGGIGNIVKKEQIAPPPAPLEPSLEVETSRDRLTTHGRGGEGNWYWHVLEEGVFKTVVKYEQGVILRNRAREEDSPKNPKSSPHSQGDRMGSPTMSDETSLCHTEGVSEDTSVSSGRSSKLSLGEQLKHVLWSSTKRWKRRSTSSFGTCSGSITTSADLHFTPATPLVLITLHDDALSPLLGSPDIFSSDLSPGN